MGTFFLVGPITLPIYMALRPLKQGEVREGGTAWNVLKNFAILWTIVMAIATFGGMMAMTRSASDLTSDAARAGAGIGMGLGLGFLGAVWFFPTMGTAALGFLLKKDLIVEVGPTGPLVGQESKKGAVGGWAGVVAAAVLGLILIGVASDSATKASSNTTNNPVITMSKYEQLETGISYRQAVTIIGAEGKELSRSTVADYSTVMYAWQNRDGSNMSAMFQNGRLVNKAQFGLN